MLNKEFDSLYAKNKILFLIIEDNCVTACEGERTLVNQKIALGQEVNNVIPALYALCYLEDHESNLDLVSSDEHDIVDIRYKVKNKVLYACLKGAESKKNSLIDKQQMRNDLHILTESLYKKNEYINKIYQLQSEFISGISHEFRTPIASVLGNLELLKKWADNKQENKIIDYIDAANSNANYLLSLVNNILDFASSALDQTVINPVNIQIHSVIEDLKSMFIYQAKKKKINLSFTIQKEVPESLYIDVTRLKQVLVNLISNALKYTEKGSIDIAVVKEDENIVFSVKDTGLGIAADKQVEIFEPFVREKRNQHKALGAGLGLAISKLLVELMDGHIEMESIIGYGSIFSVKFPCVDAQKYSTFRSELDFLGIFKEKKILITEDNDDIADLLSSIFGMYGAITQRAENGLEAISLTKAEVFDVVIMDVNMPVMGGVEAVGIIKENNSNIPVLGLSASIKLGEDLYNGQNIFDGLCPKPFEIDDLLNKVADLIRNETDKNRQT